MRKKFSSVVSFPKWGKKSQEKLLSLIYEFRWKTKCFSRDILTCERDFFFSFQEKIIILYNVWN